MHYHVDTLRAVDRSLRDRGIGFAILSARDHPDAIGRVALREKLIASHHHFRLTEKLVGRFQLRYQHGLIPMLRAMQPRVIVTTCHTGTVTEWAALRWARSAGVRRVAWQCGYEYNPGWIKNFALSRFVPMFDFHLCYHSNAKSYAMRYGAADRQVLVMHNTIDEAKILPVARGEARALLETRHPELVGKKIVLHVGSVLEEKRIEVILEALKHLDRRDVVFLLVGDGPLLPALESRFHDRGDWLPVGRIVEGVGLYFDGSDVFVLPGTGGLAINEAMAHRVPVISGYADGSADDLVVDGVTGFRLRGDSAQELAERLDDLLSDPDRARAMGTAGERRIRGALSFERFIDRVVGVLTTQHALATGR